MRSMLMWKISDYCARIGYSAALAMAVLLGCGIVHVLLLQPVVQQTDALRTEIGLARKSIGSSAGTGVESGRGSDSELRTFYEAFPGQQKMTDLLGRIYRAASENGIMLQRGDYQLHAEPDLALLRYEISLPVRGGYLDVRRFLAQILNDVPSLALEGLVFTRQRINDPGIEAQIRLALYLRPGG